MEKNNKPLWIGVIVVIIIAAVYMLATRNDGGQDDLNNMTVGEPNAETDSGAEETAPSDEVAATPNYMEPQPPVALTEAQQAQLAEGASDRPAKEITFDVTGSSFYYVPNELRVKEGDRVRIIFTNVGGTHDLVLPDFDVKTKTTQTGETDSFEFLADKKGSFEFYCSVGNGYHRQMGQTGTLIVE